MTVRMTMPMTMTMPMPIGDAPADRGALASSPSPAPSTAFATLDLFDLGRRAAAARDARFGARASFTRSRQLLGTGAWRGPRDAAESYVEAPDLDALGGWTTAAQAGARLLVGAGEAAAHQAVASGGGRSLWRLTYRSGESSDDRRARLAVLRALIHAGPRPWGVMPTPDGEAEGLDTLCLVATLRLDFPELAHIALDVAALGPRLAQMALGFGGDELWAPIVAERSLRLGGNANNPAMTRKEAITLIRGAGLGPRERTGAESYLEEPA